MITKPLTRRSFIGGCTACGVVCASVGSAALAFAEGGKIGVDARPDYQGTHTICRACPNQCGFTAYTVDGKLEKCIGDAFNPNSCGFLCARGYGYTQSTFSSANVKNPMRRKGNGEFQTISWEDALTEIGNKLSSIKDYHGSDALTFIYDASATDAKVSATLLANSLDCANVYTDDVVYNCVTPSAVAQVIGTHGYHPDTDNADLILLIDTSMADISTPNLVTSLQAARERGTKICAIDPRCGMLASMADRWIPVNPGTELALILAICQYLIENGDYDKEYVSNNVVGFQDWAAAIDEFDARWAQDISGAMNFEIDEVASWIKAASPKVAIVYGNGDIAGPAYSNSSETVRAICLLNSMLGAWNVEGGALLPYDYDEAFQEAGEDALSFGKKTSAREKTLFPMGEGDDAGAAWAIMQCAERKTKALVVFDADIAYDYISIGDIEDAFSKLELFVCISQQMTSTAKLADFVLPASPYLENGSLPDFIQSDQAAVAIASKAIDPEDGHNSKAILEIASAIAGELNSGETFVDLADKVSSERLSVFDLSIDSLADMGTSEIPDGKVSRVSTWKTPSGKIECSSSACVDAGLEAMPLWVAPLSHSDIQVVAAEDMNFGQDNEYEIVLNSEKSDPTFHLITGQQSVLGSRGYEEAELMDIAEMYDLDSAWINKDIAEILGIETGDTIAIYNNEYSCTMKAYVTARIVPTAIYIPSFFGRSSKRQKTSYQEGINPLRFSRAIVKDGYGTLCMQEASVQVRGEKEGA